MNEVRDWLTDADPVVNEPPLSDADVQRMRRAIVVAGESPQSSAIAIAAFADWARGSWAAATIVVAVTIAVSVSRWWSPVQDVRSVNTQVAPIGTPQPTARRQVQLIAPGGTRVIWIFNDEFKP